MSSVGLRGAAVRNGRQVSRLPPRPPDPGQIPIASLAPFANPPVGSTVRIAGAIDVVCPRAPVAARSGFQDQRQGRDVVGLVGALAKAAVAPRNPGDEFGRAAAASGLHGRFEPPGAECPRLRYRKPS